MERIADEYNVDFYLYGMFKSRASGLQRKRKRGSIRGESGASIDKYIELLFDNAAFTLAPLLAHPFNDFRSPIKMIEAGVANKTVLASDVPAYQCYQGRENITLLPEDGDAWYEAIREHVLNPEMCAEKGRRNRAVVEEQFNAQLLTEKRIQFYTTLLKAKK